MNAGIGDATHLAWLLAAVYHGWAGGNLLHAYEVERRPIGDLVSNSAVQIMRNRGPAMQVPEGLEDASTKGEAIRKEVGERIVAADASQFNSGSSTASACNSVTTTAAQLMSSSR